MEEKIKNLAYYINLPYTIEITQDHSEDNPGWVARVKELPGCITQADSFDELEAMIKDAICSWIEVALEDGIPIPEPRLEDEYSGKFVVRLPKSLHRDLVERSEDEGVSLNTFVIDTLARAMGTHRQHTTIPKSDQLYSIEKSSHINRVIADKD
jgi:antitoxin HicB